MKKYKKVKVKIGDEEIVRKRHQQIVQAAGELFAKKGYHSTSIREITAKAGINLSYIYQYISSKDDILYLFYRHMHQIWNEFMYKRMDELKDENAVTQLKTYIQFALEYMVNYEDKMLSMYTESRHLKKDSLYTVLYESSEIISYLDEIIKRGIREGLFKIKDSYMAANIIQYLLAIIPLKGWNLKSKYNFDQIVELITEFILKAVGVDEDLYMNIEKREKVKFGKQIPNLQPLSEKR